MLLMLSTLFAVTFNYLTNWPKITQVYRPGTCYRSQGTNEVFLVTGFRDGNSDNVSSKAIPAKIIKINNNTQHTLGEEFYIEDGDRDLKKVDCE